MDFKTLKLFLVMADEGSMLKASQICAIAQPALTRRIKALEEELGQSLFVRSNKGMELTSAGEHLYQRAQQIISLIERTKDEFNDQDLSGTISIGAGEGYSFSLIAKAISRMKQKYPLVNFKIHSGHEREVCRLLDDGLLDFGVLFGSPRATNYSHIDMNVRESWGVLMGKDHALAAKKEIVAADLDGEALIVSEQAHKNKILASFFSGVQSYSHPIATYNLVNNTLHLIREKVGVVVTLKDLIFVPDDMVFIPLSPSVGLSICLVYREQSMRNPLNRRFLQFIREAIKKGPTSGPDFVG